MYMNGSVTETKGKFHVLGNFTFFLIDILSGFKEEMVTGILYIQIEGLLKIKTNTTHMS